MLSDSKLTEAEKNRIAANVHNPAVCHPTPPPLPLRSPQTNSSSFLAPAQDPHPLLLQPPHLHPRRRKQIRPEERQDLSYPRIAPERLPLRRVCEVQVLAVEGFGGEVESADGLCEGSVGENCGECYGGAL